MVAWMKFGDGVFVSLHMNLVSMRTYRRYRHTSTRTENTGFLQLLWKMKSILDRVSGNNRISIVSIQPYFVPLLSNYSREGLEFLQREKRTIKALAMAHCVCFMSACVWQESGVTIWVECLQYSHVCVFICDYESFYVYEMCFVAWRECVCVRVFVLVSG